MNNLVTCHDRKLNNKPLHSHGPYTEFALAYKTVGTCSMNNTVSLDFVIFQKTFFSPVHHICKKIIRNKVMSVMI